MSQNIQSTKIFLLPRHDQGSTLLTKAVPWSHQHTTVLRPSCHPTIPHLSVMFITISLMNSAAGKHHQATQEEGDKKRPHLRENTKRESKLETEQATLTAPNLQNGCRQKSSGNANHSLALLPPPWQTFQYRWILCMPEQRLPVVPLLEWGKTDSPWGGGFWKTQGSSCSYPLPLLVLCYCAAITGECVESTESKEAKSCQRDWQSGRRHALEGIFNLGCDKHEDLSDLLLPVLDVFGHFTPQLSVSGLGILAALLHLLLLLLQKEKNNSLGRLDRFVLSSSRAGRSETFPTIPPSAPVWCAGCQVLI